MTRTLGPGGPDPGGTARPWLALALLLGLLLANCGTSSTGTMSAAVGADQALRGALHQLVAAKGGPPGAIVMLRRDGRTTVVTAGVADVGTSVAPQMSD